MVRADERSDDGTSVEPPLEAPTIERSAHSAPNELDPAIRGRFEPCALWVHEGRTYAVRCDGAESLAVGRDRLRPMWPGRFSWSVRNSVGHAQLRGHRGEKSASRALHVEVVARRFDDPAAQLAFVQATVRAIEREQRLDPFRDRHYEWPAHRSGPLAIDPLIDALARDEAVLDGSLTALRAQPARALATQIDRVLIAKEPTALDAADIAAASGPWEHAAGLSMNARLKGVAPREAWGAVSEHTFDCAENRWVRSELRRVIALTSEPEFDRALALRSPMERAAAARAVDRVRAALASEPLLRAVGASDPSRARAMCERREAYAAIVRWLDSAGASSTLRWPVAREAASLRDAATLYELYSFFALARAIGAALGEPVRFAAARDERGAQRGLARGAVAHIGARHALQYNREVEAYSGTLRPDFSLFCERDLLLVFDAKMRVRDGRSADDRALDEAARVDIDKMHAYRDALGARAAVCLFPGERSVLYEIDGQRREQVRVASLVRSGLAGVGAIALIPEGAL